MKTYFQIQSCHLNSWQHLWDCTCEDLSIDEF